MALYKLTHKNYDTHFSTSLPFQLISLYETRSHILKLFELQSKLDIERICLVKVLLIHRTIKQGRKLMQLQLMILKTIHVDKLNFKTMY